MSKLFSSLLVLIPSLFKHMELFTWLKLLWIFNFFSFTLLGKCSFLLLHGCNDPVIGHGLIYLYCFSIFYSWILDHFYLLKITKCFFPFLASVYGKGKKKTHKQTLFFLLLNIYIHLCNWAIVIFLITLYITSQTFFLQNWANWLTSLPKTGLLIFLFFQFNKFSRICPLFWFAFL